MEYKKDVELRWSDLDPNFHLRHSVYYDYGAYCRICFLFDNGITDAVMKQHSIGPVLFREECSFKREIVFGDKITVSLKLKSVSTDFKKFTMLHEIFKNNAELAATLIIDGAWMHTQLRRIAVPPQIIINSVDKMPKTDDFRM
jgi:acyl-CoA thioester hydrolase